MDSEIQKSREEIAKLAARVKALTARRRQREAMVKQVQDSVTSPKVDKSHSSKI